MMNLERRVSFVEKAIQCLDVVKMVEILMV